MTGAQMIGGMLAVLAVIGLAYQLFALWALQRFFRHPPAKEQSGEAVSILKPLHGAEPRLSENLATFLVQEYGGAVQMVCGVSSADDPAVAAVERLQHPAIALVINGQRHGSNAKVGNLINMLPAARHDVLILSDSDMAVRPDYLATLLTALNQPHVGAITCCYAGRGDAGFWSRISAGMISHVALPDMVVGKVTGIEQPCMGSTIALRRVTLERIGGFEEFADVLADDNAIGKAVRGLGLHVAIPPIILTHACAEASFGQLWRQKLRWAVTIRQINPWGYFGSVITRPLPLALLAALWLPELAMILGIAVLASRLCVRFMVNKFAESKTLPAYLLPVVDCLEFMVYVAAFFARSVDWRGDALTIIDKGRVAAQEKP